LRSQALASKGLQDADHKISAMPVPLKSAPGGSQTAHQLVIKFSHEDILIVLGEHALDPLALFRDRRGPFAGLEHHELGFLIQLIA
jgi:hypothetical protein